MSFPNAEHREGAVLLQVASKQGRWAVCSVSWLACSHCGLFMWLVWNPRRPDAAGPESLTCRGYGLAASQDSPGPQVPTPSEASEASLAESGRAVTTRRGALARSAFQQGGEDSVRIPP